MAAVPAGVNSLAAQHFDAFQGCALVVYEGVYAVGELDVAPHVLVPVVGRIALAPAGPPVDVGGEQTQDAQPLASSPRYLVGRLVQVDALHFADFARVNQPFHLPVLGHVAIGGAGGEGDAAGGALLYMAADSARLAAMGFSQ